MKFIYLWVAFKFYTVSKTKLRKEFQRLAVDQIVFSPSQQKQKTINSFGMTGAKFRDQIAIKFCIAND